MIKPPIAKKIPYHLKKHDDVRIDPYYWMNERDHPNVLAYIQAENEYCQTALKHLKEIENKVYNEIVDRIKKDDNTVPYFQNHYWYYTRYETDKEYPIFCRKHKTLSAEEEIILDANERARAQSYYHVQGLSVSTNNELLAFGEDITGRRQYTIYIKNLKTNEIFEHYIENTTGASVWDLSNEHLFFCAKR